MKRLCLVLFISVCTLLQGMEQQRKYTGFQTPPPSPVRQDDTIMFDDADSDYSGYAKSLPQQTKKTTVRNTIYKKKVTIDNVKCLICKKTYITRWGTFRKHYKKQHPEAKQPPILGRGCPTKKTAILKAPWLYHGDIEKTKKKDT